MMDAEIGRETTAYSQLAKKNVSPIAPAETTFDWPNTVTWIVSNTAWITNKVNKERENANIDLKKKKILKQTDVYCSVLEGKRHQSLAKADKLNFYMIETRRSTATEPSKTKTWCPHDAHQHMCDLWHVICQTRVKQLCSRFFEKKSLLL